LLDFLKTLGRGDRAAAADSGVEQPQQHRPSIGLVLGGGAARGFAHIGVIKTLIARGLVPERRLGRWWAAVTRPATWMRLKRGHEV
jgi:NTE family protein